MQAGGIPCVGSFRAGRTLGPPVLAVGRPGSGSCCVVWDKSLGFSGSWGPICIIEKTILDPFEFRKIEKESWMVEPQSSQVGFLPLALRGHRLHLPAEQLRGGQTGPPGFQTTQACW